MQEEIGSKTKREHWDAAWSRGVRPRVPSRLNVDVLNNTRLLARHIRPGMKYMEIGCAPGKLLAWVASTYDVQASGLDYSNTGIANCRSLFKALQMDISLHHEDIFNHRLAAGTYDIVSSFGVIEHFDDPRQIVQCHVDLAKPGGLVIITVPNYRGIYGRLQRWCDPANLDLHNLDIMTVPGLAGLVDPSEVEEVRAYAAGSISPWIVSLDRKLPRPAALALWMGCNLLGLVQPLTIKALAPMLVLEVRKKRFSGRASNDQPAPAGGKGQTSHVDSGDSSSLRAAVHRLFQQRATGRSNSALPDDRHRHHVRGSAMAT